MLFLSAWNWYGFLIAMGMVIGMFGAAWVARWRGFRGDVAFDICLWAIPLAIVGARLNFVITDAISDGSYVGWDGFLKVFGFENGEFQGMFGLSIYGGLIGAVVGIFCNSLVYKRHRTKQKRAVADGTLPAKAIDNRYDETFLNMMDLGAPFMVLGQAIGRWGNLANKELYGAEITNPAFQWFPVGLEINGTWYQALSFYESLLNFACCALLLWLLLGKRRSRPGFVVAIYFIWYGIVRAVLEMQRQPEFIMYWGKMPVSLLDSLVLIVVGLGMIVWFIVQARREGKRIPIYLKRSQWGETGRDMFEWGRDYHEKLPPLFKRKVRTDEGDGEDELSTEPDDETEPDAGGDLNGSAKTELPQTAKKKNLPRDVKTPVQNEVSDEAAQEKTVGTTRKKPAQAYAECPECGSRVSADAKECPYCGKKIS